MSAALTTNGLGHRYGHRYGRHHWGLQDCSLTIEAGSVVALIGPNGSGKTTLLNMAAGLLQPTSGTVEIHGSSPDRQLERVGYVAQDAPLWPRLRVADVLDIGACMIPRFDRPFAEQRVRDLDVPFKSRIGNLSGGQRAQVALTLVLAKRPDLLLLDEPLANLDPGAAGAVEPLIGRSSGVARVLISHDVAHGVEEADLVLGLRGGKQALLERAAAVDAVALRGLYA
jgi:ABC-2 type transport system ATP-binding protein